MHASPPFSPARRRRWVSLAIGLLLAVLAAQSMRTMAQEQRGTVPDSEPQAVVANGKYYALVIGINEYPAPLNKLRTAVNDANAVGEVLHDRFGFQVQYLFDSDATRFSILSALSKLRRSLTENDSLLIYYAGHGYFDRDTDKAYWLPIDADSGTSPNTIMADDLTSLIRALPSRHVLIVSDSCYSGGLSRDADGPVLTGNNPTLIARELRSRSRTLMASGGVEPVADSGEGGHSVFANAILRSLEQAQDPAFTAVDLFYSSIRRQVAGKSTQLPQYETIRNSNDEGGDFVFVRHEALEKGSGSVELTDARVDELIDKRDYAEVLPLFERACGAGVGPGCFGLGSLYRDGLGISKDEARSAGLFGKACNAGSARGCAKLAWEYENGVGVAKDQAQAVVLLRKACDGRDAISCGNLGLAYERGDGVGKDQAQAATLFRKACDGGEPRGCSSLGVAYERGDGVVKDQTLALALYRKACDGGDAAGCGDLGQEYENGKGVAKDEAQAVAFYRKACDGNEWRRCTNLGIEYKNGTGVAKDEAQATELFVLGCDGGDGRGCAILGWDFEHGTGVDQNDEQAADYYRRACDGDYAPGCVNLGLAYENGKWVEKDLTQAARLYGKACDAGVAVGCGKLGVAYENGNGVVKDQAQAATLYRKACDGGNQDGCSNLKRLQP